MAGMHPPQDYDAEADPEYETALRAWLAAHPPVGGGPTRPMGAPVAALDGMATGATPRRIVGPTLTIGPNMTVGTFDGVSPELTPEEKAAQGPLSGPPKPSLLDRASNAAAEMGTAPGLLQAMRGEPRTERTPLQAISDKLEDFRNPLPDVSMPLPGEAPAASVPALEPKTTRVQLGHAAHVEVPNTAVVQSRDPGAGRAPPAGAPPASPDPVQRALTAAALSTRPPQGDVDLEAALQAAAGRRLVAGLARAGGSMVGRGQGAAYDALDREAEVPVQEFGMRRGLAEQERQRAALEAAAAAARGKEAFGEEMARKHLSLEERKVAEEERSHKATEAIKARKAGGPKALTPAQELQREKFDQTLREKASKDSEGASELADTLDRLEGALKGKDLPGVGRVVGTLAAHGVGSDAGIRMRSDLQRLADVILRARSGAAVTPSEAERLAIESGTASGATEQQVRIATATALGIMRRAQSNLKAKYPGKTWETIASEGGWTPGAPTSAAGAPAPQSGPPRISSVEEYNALPPGTPYIDPNGKPKVKR